MQDAEEFEKTGQHSYTILPDGSRDYGNGVIGPSLEDLKATSAPQAKRSLLESIKYWFKPIPKQEQEERAREVLKEMAKDQEQKEHPRTLPGREPTPINAQAPPQELKKAA